MILPEAKASVPQKKVWDAPELSIISRNMVSAKNNIIAIRESTGHPNKTPSYGYFSNAAGTKRYATTKHGNPLMPVSSFAS